MSNYGSYYGWVYSECFTREQALADLKSALLSEGLSLFEKTDELEVTDDSGFQRIFRFDNSRQRSGIATGSNAIFTQSRKIQFRPLNFKDYPEDHAITRKEYQFLKIIFDRCGATEAFAFHAMQDNARLFYESNLEFLFHKAGPQLILRFLEEMRDLEDEEERDIGPNDLEYLPMLDWDMEILSSYFTRFSGEDSRRGWYSFANSLVRLPWDEFYHGP